MAANVERHLLANEFAAGDRFIWADTHLASVIAFITNVMKGPPQRPAFAAYLSRIVEREAHNSAQAMDRETALPFPVLVQRIAGRPLRRPVPDENRSRRRDASATVPLPSVPGSRRSATPARTPRQHRAG